MRQCEGAPCGQFGQHNNQNNFPTTPNPYSTFRFFCATLNTRDHAKLCVMLSFAMFLCLVVTSLVVFRAMSLFFIVVGVTVYILLMKSVFGTAEKLPILFYLFFEAIQIGFYLALLLYCTLPMVLPPPRNCYERVVYINGTIYQREICDDSPKFYSNEYISSNNVTAVLLLLLVLLITTKLYFARLFAHFYKFLVWNERMSVHRAQYIHGNDIHITMTPPPAFWDNNRFVPEYQMGQLPAMGVPPSYSQVIGQKDGPKPKENDGEADQSKNENGEGESDKKMKVEEEGQ